jgi:hypothetical protein
VRTFLVGVIAIILIIGVVNCFAVEKCPKTCCAMGLADASKAAGTDKTQATDPHAGCPMKDGAKAAATTDAKVTETSTPGAAVEAQPASAIAPVAKEANAKMAEGSCPDVTGKTQLNTFHDLMHPMHTALGKGDYATIRANMPKLYDASKGLAECKCPMGDKCPPDCKKNYEAKKTALIKSVDDLNVACQGKDDKKVEETFTVMHSAYIEFAGMCNPSAKEGAAKTSEAKTKAVNTGTTK